MLKKCLSKKETTWKLTRTEIILPKLKKIQLSESNPTIVEAIPLPFPQSTKAIIVSVFCDFGNDVKISHAYLLGEIRQKGSSNSGMVKIDNRHFSVYANTWYNELHVPWDNNLPNELELKVTGSYNTGGSNNWYDIKVVGFVSV